MSSYFHDSDLKGLYENWPTEKLLDAAAHPDDYRPEAIEVIRAELARRKIDESAVSATRATIAHTPPIDKVRQTFEQRKLDLFWARFGAFVADGILSYLILIFGNLVLGDDLYGRTLPVWLALFSAYYIFPEGRYSATPGKRLFGLKVVTVTLEPCGYWKATLRFLLRIVECFGAPMIALISYVSTERRQRLGDLLAKTLVVRAEDLK